MPHILHCNTPNSWTLNNIMKKKYIMNKVNDGNDLVEQKYLSLLLFSLATVVLLSLVLPFPISFLVSIIVIFSFSIIRADMALKKAGMGGIKDWYKALSPSQSGRERSTENSGCLYKSLTFYCMCCDSPHNKIACPKCGSKAVRAR